MARSRRPAYLCTLCEERGKRSTAYRSLGGLERHSQQVHKTGGVKGSARVEGAWRRVWVQP